MNYGSSFYCLKLHTIQYKNQYILFNAYNSDKRDTKPLGKIKGKTFAPYAHKSSAGNSNFPALFLYWLIQMVISVGHGRAYEFFGLP